MTDMSWSSTWSCCSVIDEYIGPCYYDTTISFEMLTNDSREQTVVFGRIRSLIKDVYQDAVFIGMDNPLLQVFKKQTKQQTITFPQVPNDLMVSLITWKKIDAICEGRARVNNVMISCDQSDNLTVHYDEDFAHSDDNIEEFNLMPWDKQPAWWFRTDSGVGDWMEILDEEKSKLHLEVTPWPDHLQWDYKIDDTKKTDVDNVVPMQRGWKPQVIPGDKT
jgi:hypothetical protein